VTTREDDPRRDYARIVDASGAAGVLDDLLARLSKGGEIVLAGFYEDRLDFDFTRAFLREARLRVSAEWKPADLSAVARMASDGTLDLSGLVSHVSSARQAPEAYRTAFEDSSCLKLLLDWRTAQ
jgi:3-hydroxyethyl bacteriochlorophyllide a dehydrogenase